MLSGSEPSSIRAGYVPEVDALRGLAMTGVVAMHCGLAPFGWMGVWVFYVISGFAVTTSWLGRRETTAAAAVTGFYVRRARRIWPLYFAYVAGGAAFLALTGDPAALGDLPWLATFTFNLRMIGLDDWGATGWAGFGHLWTISVEQQFYLLLPVILLAGNRRTAIAALVALALAAPAIRHLVVSASLARGWDLGHAAFAAYAFAPAHFDAFAAGALVALARRAGRIGTATAIRAAWIAAGIATLHVGTFVALGLMRHGIGVEALRNVVSGILAGDGREVTVYLVPVSIGVATLLAVLAGQGWALRLGRLPGLQAIGRVSYGGYVLHLPVIIALRASVFPGALGPAGRAGLFLAAMAASVALATASHRWFEARFLGRRRRALPGRSRSAVAA